MMSSRVVVVALFCFAAATSASALATLTGHVVGITNGDTLTLLDDSKQQHSEPRAWRPRPGRAHARPAWS
jgi:hypothetical protein